jgi:MerR family mercuric resistance operon transcriptional regulator
MRISEVAREAGVGVETVRFYEQRGLIRQPPRPRTGGYRDYPDAVVRRIRFVRRAQQLGFSLNEIVELMALESGDQAACVDVRQRAEAKLDEVAAKIADLERIRGALRTLIEACPGEGPVRQCSILEAIGDGDLRLAPTGNRGR